ncbi:MAG: hypothetical protein M1829_000726 [Trizodia sp. TS-e1964]|nr:MAG: hypothetical protein M1829_000726 [Trizodia sp. TS-e1964]
MAYLRTHRERKELYIKALEQEVVRLKESFSLLTQERAAVDEENRRLKEILLQNGISWPNAGNGAIAFAPGASSSGSISGSYAAGPGSQGFSPTLGSAYSQAPPAHNGPGIPQQQHGVDYDQIGIDFVLTLEHPCMDHMLYLCLQAQNDDEDISGHALMASCPPESHLLHHPDIPFPYKTWDIQKSDLANLMDLSKRLNLDGEITPVMAWATILSHPRFGELTKLDFDVLVDDLKAKVRCYGFGAVLEEFEVRDALSNLFATKLEDL